MFLFHIALALCLMGLVSGCALYVYACNCGNKGTCFAKLMAVIVILLSIASTLCTMYYGKKLWEQDSNGQCTMCTMHDMQMQEKPMINGKTAHH
jgi:hypothetical protein